MSESLRILFVAAVALVMTAPAAALDEYLNDDPAPVDDGRKKWNLRASAIGPVFGVSTIRGDRRFGDKLMLGAYADFHAREVNDVDVQGVGLGVAVEYFPRGQALASGWALDFSLGHLTIEGSAKDATNQKYKSDTQSVAGRALGVYHWFGRHFNASVGAGFNFNSQDKIEVKDPSGRTVKDAKVHPIGLAYDLMIGLAF